MDLSNLSSNLPLTKPIDQDSVNEVNKQLATEFKNAAKSVTTLYNLKLKLSEDDKTKTTKNDDNTNGTNQQNIEFANAAKSVASLYRLSNNSNGLNYHYGYLSCLKDLLTVISDEGDVENWALTKMAEFNKTKHGGIGSTTDRTSDSDSDGTTATTINNEIETLPEDFKLPSEYEFSLDHDYSVPYNFKPSYPPMSVNHSQRQRTNWLQIKKEKENLKWKRSLQHSTNPTNSTNITNEFKEQSPVNSPGSDGSYSDSEPEESVGKRRKNHDKHLRKRKELKKE